MGNSQNEALGFTPREIYLINECKQVMSKPFYMEYENNDEAILRFINLVVMDINYVPPLTAYEVNSIPPFFDAIIILGTQFYSMLFLAQKWTMNDFSYNEGGISLSFDRVDKISKVQEKFFELYRDKTKNVKINQLNALTLATPRMSNQLGMFIRLAISG